MLCTTFFSFKKRKIKKGFPNRVDERNSQRWGDRGKKCSGRDCPKLHPMAKVLLKTLEGKIKTFLPFVPARGWFSGSSFSDNSFRKY